MSICLVLVMHYMGVFGVLLSVTFAGEAGAIRRWVVIVFEIHQSSG
jgi:hypothetical protein